MDTPQLVLIPPTPLSYTIPSPLTQLTSSASADPSKSPRSSSETAIVSIYSMYGDQDTQNPWPPTVLDPVGKRKKANHATAVQPKNFLSPQQTHPEPMEMSSCHAEHELSYLSAQSDDLRDPPGRPATTVEDHSHLSAPAIIINNNLNASATNSPLHLGSRPNSSLSTSSSAHSTFESASVGRSSTESKRVVSPLTPTLSSPNLDSPTCLGHRSRTKSLPKRPPDNLRMSDSANVESPPVPVSSDHLLLSNHETPKKIPPSSGPPTPHNTPLFLGDASCTPSPSSKVSLTPSRGEDADAFLVRSTYALLDVQGVKGDGYEEGVERTRAKIGSSPASQRDADRAIADEREKKRELTAQEITVLGSLDRYGFFATSLHDRLVLMPSAPLRRRLTGSASRAGNAPDNARSLSSLPPASLHSKEYTRISKWNRMLLPGSRDAGGNIQSWTIRPSKQDKLRWRVYKGIPDRWRTAVWDLLMARYARSGPSELSELMSDYHEAADKPSSYDVQIDLDVPRTISGHVLFHTRYGAGQRSLFRVLHAFSLRCGECGYVQGMGPIAATLLCYFDFERVYTSLVRLHDAYNLHRIFSPGFPGLLEAIFVQERLTRSTMPGVYAAFSRHMVSTTAYATKWYITLFANTVPFQTQLRLWDAFLLDGPDVFIAMSVAIVWVYRNHITSRSATFETVLSLLSSFFVPEDEDALLFWIGKTLGNRKLRAKMAQWRTEWRSLVSRGEDAKALL